MRKREASMLRILNGALVALLLVTFFAMSCSTPGSKAPASPSATPSGVKLTVTPSEGVATKDNKITISATGLKSREEIRIRITTSPELDATSSVEPELKVTDSGTFETKLSLQDFPPGSYLVKIIGRGEQELDSKPLTVIAPAKTK